MIIQPFIPDHLHVCAVLNDNSISSEQGNADEADQPQNMNNHDVATTADQRNDNQATLTIPNEESQDLSISHPLVIAGDVEVTTSESDPSVGNPITRSHDQEITSTPSLKSDGMLATTLIAYCSGTTLMQYAKKLMNLQRFS